MMDEPVTHTGLVDISWLWVVDLKWMVRTVFIRFIYQLLMESEDVVYEVQGELSYILAFSFSA